MKTLQRLHISLRRKSKLLFHVCKGYSLSPHCHLSPVTMLSLTHSALNTLAYLLFLKYSWCSDPSECVSQSVTLKESFSSCLHSLLCSLGLCSYLYLPIRIMFLLSIILNFYLLYIFFLELIPLNALYYICIYCLHLLYTSLICIYLLSVSFLEY